VLLAGDVGPCCRAGGIGGVSGCTPAAGLEGLTLATGAEATLSISFRVGGLRSTSLQKATWESHVTAAPMQAPNSTFQISFRILNPRYMLFATDSSSVGASARPHATYTPHTADYHTCCKQSAERDRRGRVLYHTGERATGGPPHTPVISQASHREWEMRAGLRCPLRVPRLMFDQSVSPGSGG